MTPYSGSYPLQTYDSDNDNLGDISFDPSTGDAIFITTHGNQSAPISILQTEWRKDVSRVYQEIGNIHKEVFIKSTTCPDNNPPEIDGPYVYYVEAGDLICFNITTNDHVFVPPPPASPLNQIQLE
ncbi:MAG: hypothetical protein COA58_06265 [Bacteroidetes bacterium]|nr:MAG: hypothetical protein COA58_06265 [Bacteroidota bacterium]